MFTLEISLEDIKLFLAIVIAGAVYGQYLYHKGKKRGWDLLAWELTDAGYLKIDEETLEVSRVSDKEYNRLKQSNSFAE